MRNHSILSGKISLPPGAVGSFSWHSGVERPWKRMPYATKVSEWRAISRNAQCTDLVGIKDRRIPEHSTDTTHAADDLLDGGLLDLLVAMLGFLYECFNMAKYFNE